METVYVETTVVGHLVGRVHPDPVIAGRQAATRNWWKQAVVEYRLPVSRLVIEECSAGNPDVAQERLEILESIERLDSSPEVDVLVSALLESGAVPASEPRDAFHIAIAAVNGVRR